MQQGFPEAVQRGARSMFDMLANGGVTVSLEWVCENLARPVLEVDGDADRLEVMSLAEAMEQTGRNRKWFESPLDALGGISRLELWAQEGDAQKLQLGWVIKPAVIHRIVHSQRVDEEDPMERKIREIQGRLSFGGEHHV